MAEELHIAKTGDIEAYRLSIAEFWRKNGVIMLGNGEFIDMDKLDFPEDSPVLCESNEQ